MARRSASSSLRRRFAWTFGSAAVVAIVSLISLVVYKASKQQLDAAKQNQIAQQAEAVAPPDGAQAGAGGVAPAPLPGPKAAGNFHSDRYGYGVALEGTPWVRWENLAQSVGEAEFGALLGERTRLLVIPISLGQLNPRPEALNRALMERLSLAYPSEAVKEVKPIEHRGATGQQIYLTREVEGIENDYLVWVLRRGSFAYLAAAWTGRSPDGPATNDQQTSDQKSDGELAPQKSDADLAALQDVLSRIQFDEPSPAPLDLAELSPFSRQTHGKVYNALGWSAHDTRDWAGAVACFRQAFELQPDDPIFLTNLVRTQIDLEQYGDALAVLQQHIDRFPEQLDLWAIRAYLLSQAGEVDSALAAYATLFAAGYRAEAPFIEYALLLSEQDRTDESLQAVEQFLQMKESFAVRRLQALLYRKRGNHERAIEVLTGLAQDRPFNVELAYDLAETYTAAEQFNDALEVCRQLLENHYDTAHTFALQARCQFALKWYPEAKASLEAALKREPTHRQAQELLNVVSATLGEGSHRGISEPIEPVSIPAELETSSDAVGASGADAELQLFGAYFVRRNVAIQFTPGQELKSTDRRFIHVLDASGIVRFSTIQIPFDPLTERLYVNRLRVTDAQGREVAAGKPTDCYVIDGGGLGAASHAKLLNIPVPGLHVGRTIELVFSRLQLSPPQEFPYRIHTFSEEVPVLSAALYLRAPADLIQAKATPGIQRQKLEDGELWTIERPLVYRFEPLQPAADDFLPTIVLNAAGATWPSSVKQYIDSIADRLKLDDAVAALAKEIVAKLPEASRRDPAARAAAMANYVQSNLTYKAIEFGRHARVPNAVADVLSNKYGDCKDHALLLVQLLRAEGIDAHLALANLQSTVDPDISSLDQFNHMLVFVPSIGRGRFFDCTDKNSDLAKLTVPLDLGAAKVLVLDPANPRFVDVPAYAPDSSEIVVKRTVQIDNLTGALIEEKVTVDGYQAAFLRSLFREVPATDRAALLREELAPKGDLQIQSLDIKHLDSRSGPLTFYVKYSIKGSFHAADGAVLGQIPALWERMYLDVIPTTERRTPFEIQYPLHFTSSIDVLVPEGYEAAPLTSMNDSATSPFATWKLQTSSEPKRLHINYELQLPAGRYPATEYEAYEAAMEKAIGCLAQNVAFKRQTTNAPSPAGKTATADRR